MCGYKNYVHILIVAHKNFIFHAIQNVRLQNSFQIHVQLRVNVQCTCQLIICDAIKQNESEVENFSFLFFGIVY